MFADIGGIVDHSLSDDQQLHQYQQKSPLTPTH
jgi:hypothetical protein